MPPADKPRSRAKKGAHAGPRSASRLTDALAEAGWSEADYALAEAIAEFTELENAIAELKGSAAAKAHAEDALALVTQALARVGRRRGLKRIGKAGEIVDFDPGVHEFAQTPSFPPSRVKVVTEGVMRGGEVLVAALVKPVRAPKKRSRR